MGRKAKHHYIPRGYLKGFTKEGKKSSPFLCVPKNNSQPFITNPNDACAQRDYYKVQHPNPLLIEDWYGETIEPKIERVISRISDTSALPLSSERPDLDLLLATLFLRVPSFRDTLEAPMKRAKEIVDSISDDVNLANKSEFEYNQTDLIKTELNLIETVIKSLSQKYYQLHIIESEEPNFIMCDRPFVLSHPNGGDGMYFGLNTPNIEICVPITRKVLLVAQNRAVKEEVFEANEQIVGLANTKQMISANKFFYTCDKSVLLINEDLSVHNHVVQTPLTCSWF
ncbi:hypothetical protein PSE_2707 [Pseudovibrio sp. FO-BEG1]|uniref:DUF4238 domain-containing protein n=1 Tax=Pseudovibrio sp. (strain FO-BEG1) TaxID=911045 RepID=UPI000238C29B|nr:DUF4238 domain-containing protein [Pseudovibrio sp. FO-BEG1]AEV37215.1 hypothetical protein PSE_2707 [Pseudovibrio sp. FO-BEG1]